MNAEAGQRRAPGTVRPRTSARPGTWIEAKACVRPRSLVGHDEVRLGAADAPDSLYPNQDELRQRPVVGDLHEGEDVRYAPADMRLASRPASRGARRHVGHESATVVDAPAVA